jgi:superfamily I DNA/RNA helicase
MVRFNGDRSARPFLVLAGPATGKTSTMVESFVDRVVRGGG